jgi:ribosome biogenesis GTPase
MQLEEFGWTQSFESAFETYACDGCAAGRVFFSSRELFAVYTQAGEIDATLSGRLRHSSAAWPVVGDWVVLRDRSIDAVLPRRTRFSRKDPGRRTVEQVIAANIDVVFLVSGLDHNFNLRRIERSLVLAWESGAAPVIVLNKSDLREDAEDVVRAVKEAAPGAPVIAANALTAAGLPDFSRYVGRGQTAALIGSSGVGKSTIINRLLGDERQRVLEVREDDSRGRHTTTHRELILLPAGWLIMDQPGLRELQIWSGDEGIDRTFEDIGALAAGCRFRDCRHEGEPDCAVAAALADESLDPRRFQNFTKMRREIEYIEREQDTRARLEQKQKWKRIHQQMKQHYKHHKRW